MIEYKNIKSTHRKVAEIIKGYLHNGNRKEILINIYEKKYVQKIRGLDNLNHSGYLIEVPRAYYEDIGVATPKEFSNEDNCLDYADSLYQVKQYFYDIENLAEKRKIAKSKEKYIVVQLNGTNTNDKRVTNFKHFPNEQDFKKERVFNIEFKTNIKIIICYKFEDKFYDNSNNRYMDSFEVNQHLDYLTKEDWYKEKYIAIPYTDEKYLELTKILYQHNVSFDNLFNTLNKMFKYESGGK